MTEIAKATYNYEDFDDVMNTIYRRVCCFVLLAFFSFWKEKKN